MNATQSVIFGTFVSFVVFMLSGSDGRDRVVNGIRSASGRDVKAHNPAEDHIVTTQVMVGWAVLFIILVALADVPATAPFGAGFAWLMLISTLIIFGESAFNNVTNIITGSAAQ